MAGSWRACKVLLIDWSKFPSRRDQSIALHRVISREFWVWFLNRHFVRKPVVASRNLSRFFGLILSIKFFYSDDVIRAPLFFFAKSRCTNQNSSSEHKKLPCIMTFSVCHSSITTKKLLRAYLRFIHEQVERTAKCHDEEEKQQEDLK